MLAKTRKGFLISFEMTSKAIPCLSIGEDTLFKHFACFEPEVYFGIIASIIVISFVTSLYKQSLKSFFTTFWSYLSVILSDYHSIKIRSTFEKIFAGLWLIVCTLLLAAFSGQLRDFVLKPKPIYWIDSVEDLYQWKHLTIQTSVISELKYFSENFPNNSMAQDFSKRFQLDQVNEGDLMSFDLDWEGLLDGRVAVVYPYFILQVIKRSLVSNGFLEDIDFHISSGDESQPFYSMSNKINLDEELADKFDLV